MPNCELEMNRNVIRRRNHCQSNRISAISPSSCPVLSCMFSYFWWEWLDTSASSTISIQDTSGSFEMSLILIGPPTIHRRANDLLDLTGFCWKFEWLPGFSFTSFNWQETQHQHRDVPGQPLSGGALVAAGLPPPGVHQGHPDAGGGRGSSLQAEGVCEDVDCSGLRY